MIDIQVNNLQKSFGDKEVLCSVSFQVQQGEHIGLLGANGAGKTTVFRLLSGAYKPDAGQISIAPGKRVGLLSQIPEYPPDFLVRDVMREAFRALDAMAREMDALVERMDKDEQALKRYGELQHRYEARGGFETDLKLALVRQGLKIGDGLYESPFARLSGGEKTRINLARLMLEDTDILLLDEPTNHLDLSSVEWLEDTLAAYRGTVVVIAHDRFFLDAVITRVVEIEDGVSLVYKGNYSAYAMQKQQRYEDTLKRYEHEQHEIKRLEAVARRMHDYAGKSAKLHRRAFAIEKRAARIQTVDRPKKQAELRQRFRSLELNADDALQMVELKKSYGEKVLLDGVTLGIKPGERVALIGDNGSGKTTLMHIIAGLVKPDSGLLRVGPQVRMTLLPQEVRFENPERTLYDCMLYEAGCTPQQARDRLGGFHFQGEDVFQTVSTLSGGEKSRLKLCILMGESINLLLLDEPTNHLDIQSREWMESAVEGYGQTMLFISHDRYFLSRFATRIWALQDGRLTDFHGSYEQYRLWLELQREQTPSAPKTVPKSPRPSVGRDERAEERKKRVLEREMAALEQREGELDELMLENGHDAALLSELMEEKQLVSSQWHIKFKEWEGYAG